MDAKREFGSSLQESFSNGVGFNHIFDKITTGECWHWTIQSKFGGIHIIGTTHLRGLWIIFCDILPQN